MRKVVGGVVFRVDFGSWGVECAPVRARATYWGILILERLVFEPVCRRLFKFSVLGMTRDPNIIPIEKSYIDEIVTL